jgi:hypothetical protein
MRAMAAEKRVVTAGKTRFLTAANTGFLKETAAASLTDPASSLMLQRRQLPRVVWSTKTAGFGLLQTCNQQPDRFAGLRCSRVNGGPLGFLEETGHGTQAAKQEGHYSTSVHAASRRCHRGRRLLERIAHRPHSPISSRKPVATSP